MSLADDLLEQAELLAGVGRGRPKQANLRRAVSSAYYALFHRLIEAAAGLFVKEDFSRFALIARSFDHGRMKKACTEFKKNSLPESLRLPSVPYQTPSDLLIVAEAFVKLQELRHQADYNLDRLFSRPEARRLVQECRAAFASWKNASGTDDARLFLACFLLWDTWHSKVRT